MNYIGSNESKMITIARVCAMLFIVICHIVDNIPNISFLCQVFYVGVQMFFLISAILYGKKEVKDFKKFYLKSFCKLSIPIYLYFLFSLILLFINKQIAFESFKDIFIVLFNVFGFVRKLTIFNVEVGHLWFVTYIYICYMLIPALQRIRNFDKKRRLLFCIIVGLIHILCIMIFDWNPIISNFYGVVIFVCAYLFAHDFNLDNLNLKKYVLISLFMIVGVSSKLLGKYYSDTYFGYYELVYNGVIASYSMVPIAVWLIVTIGCVYKILGFRYYNIIQLIGDYSYYVYITHYIFIVGPISILNVNELVLTLLYLLGVVILYSIILKLSTNLVMKYIKI